MARFRVRDISNVFWMDVCYFEIYVRNEDDTGWDRLLPNGDFFVRNGDNTRWMEICCTDETINRCPDFGDPYDPNNPLSPNNPGVIIGPDGEVFGPEEPAIPSNPDNTPFDPTDGYDSPSDGGTGEYPDGYGFGDPGTQDPRVIPDPSSPSGDSIITYENSPNGDVLTYTDDLNEIITRPVTDIVSSGDPGTLIEPIQCPASVQSAGVNIMQLYHELKQVSGIARFSYQVYTGSVEFRIYHNGQLVAQTPGPQITSGEMQFSFDLSEGGDRHVIVQSIAMDANSEYVYLMPCPNTIDDTYGTPTEPAPCHAVVTPTWGTGRGVQETYHAMGPGAGNVVVEYNFFNQADKMDIFYRGVRVAGTPGFVSGSGEFSFAYNPVNGVEDILVRMEGADAGTSYVYRMFCPDQLGSHINPLPCGTANAIIGQGSGITDTWIDLGATDGQVAVEYNAFNVPDTFEVYQGSTLVATTNGDVSGEGQIGFQYDHTLGQLILIRVIGSTGEGDTTWGFRCACPALTGPEVNIQAANGNNILPELDGSYQIFYAEVVASDPAIIQSTVEWYIVYSGAADSDDVTFQSGVATLEPGDSSVEIPIQVNSDYDAEPDETFSVQIANPTNVTIGATDTVTFTIQNDDFVTNPDITISPGSGVSTLVDEGDSGDQTAVVCVIALSGPTSQPLSVDWDITVSGVSNPATIGDDVVAGSGTVTFQPGETSKPVSAIIIGDDVQEGDEEFKAVISNNTSGTITQGEVLFTIRDDEIPVVACNNTTNSGGAGVTETYHDLGGTAGTAVVSYDMLSVPDQMDIYYENNLIASTGGFVSGTGSFNIAWNPQPGDSTLIKIVVTGSSSGTAWDYEVFCPS